MGHVQVLLGFWMCVVFTVTAQDLLEGKTCNEINGRRWQCKNINDCPKAKNISKEEGLKLCNSTGEQVTVCCEPDSKSQPVGTKSKIMCEDYSRGVRVMIPVVPGISNGENADFWEFPHMALVGFGNASSIDWLCGGSLISDRFVLSAAHCSISGRGVARWVRLGDHNFKSKEDEKRGFSKTFEYEIVEIINHPDYKTSSFYNDITLYKLNTTVFFNEFIRPTCLHTEKLIPEGQYTATGWGNLEWGGKQSDILQKVKLLIYSEQECKDAYNITIAKLKDGIKKESMFCAGDVKRGRDTCSGDSGGPLQVRHTYLYNMYLQVGLTSFGSVCGGNRPGVYTRISHFIPWIENIVWP